MTEGRPETTPNADDSHVADGSPMVTPTTDAARLTDGATEAPPVNDTPGAAGGTGAPDVPTTGRAPGRVVGWLGRAVASIGLFALLSALLFYFGWVHTAAQAKYFGFDSTFYELSSTDYTLRSVSAALPAFAVGAIVALAATILYDRVDTALVDRAIRRRVSSAALLVGAIAIVLGVARLGADQSTDPAQGMLLLAGGGLLGGGALLGDLRRRDLVVGIAVLLVVAGSFQAVRSLASATGRARAEESALEVDSTALVRVFADADLHLTRVGSLVVTPIAGGGQTTYVYDCLHVLDRIGDRLFLVPHGYSTRANRRVVYVVEMDAVRVDVDSRYVERREAPPCPD